MTKNKKIRALIVPYRYCPPRNGGQHVAYAFSEFINQKEKMYCLSTDNNQVEGLAFELIPFFKDNKSKYFNPIIAWKLFRFFKQNQIEECILFQPFAFLMVLPTLLFSKTKISIYIQNLEYQRFRSIGKAWWPLMYVWEKISYQLSSKLYFVATSEMAPACQIFNLDESKCIPAPAGTKYTHQPTPNPLRITQIQKQHKPTSDTKLLLFYGSRDYEPNFQAVKTIIDQLIPTLRQQTPTPFLILIAGLGKKYLPASDNIHYLGYVDNINDYIQSVDLILNPVNQGAGIQTKILEALSLGTTVIASQHASKGIDKQLSGKKMVIVPNNNSQAWCHAITQHWAKKADTPQIFYDNYYWGYSLREV